jgi:shikimate dehydrogenase
MHNAAYRALGLSFTYVPFAVESSDLPGALAGMRALGIRGFGVSMPFKQEVIPLLDRLDPLASRIGAVNTIVNEQGTLVGHNTDAWGAARALEEAMPLRGQRVLLLGAGGAARAVAFSLATQGMRVHIANRTAEKAEALARDVNASSPAHPVSAGPLSALPSPESYDALVNCSSAGMHEHGEASPVSSAALRPGLVVMDIVYKPIRTRLLELAERYGARTVHGGRMLLHQACRQVELYTGRPAPYEVMHRAIEAEIMS